MKREGYLIEHIADPDNLRLAFWKARKGKNHNCDVEAFRRRLDCNLLLLRTELLSGNLTVGDYRYFMVYDPKQRLICAAAFRERVLHHAIMNVCHDSFEQFQIYDSYATRPGKGQYAALERAKVHTRRYRWFCKMDVRKFFDSISHSVLLGQLARRFKDPLLLNIFAQIIASYQTKIGTGLPIGNLTSQYFANLYMAHADHYAKEILQQKAYLRYMDDVVMWHNCKDTLIRRSADFEAYIGQVLHMSLKPSCINACQRGVPMLGYVVFPDLVRLNKTSKKRFIHKYKYYHTLMQNDICTQAVYSKHILPMLAFTRFADAKQLRITNEKLQMI